MPGTNRVPAGLASLAVIAALAGCNPASTGGTETLSVACSQTEDFCEGMVSAFTEATGVPATYLGLGSGEVIARLQSNQGSGPEFDVWAGGQSEKHLVAEELGFIEPYASPEAEDLDSEYVDSEGAWAGFYTDSLAFCVNTTGLADSGLETPSSWDDLTDPSYKDTVLLPNPHSVGTGYMAIWTQMVLNDGDENATMSYFKDLDENILQYSESAANATLMVGRGEADVAIALDSDCATAKQSGMSDLETIYPDEGTGFEVGAVSVLSGTENTALAQQFYDWVLTTDAQDLYPDFNSNAAPVNPGAKLGEGVPDQSQVNQVEWDAAEAADAEEGLLSRYTDDVQS
ncbi:hypothetical protein GCM10009591_11330 [Brachybacterium tyrofermentans]